MKVESREYKLLVDHGLFQDPTKAVASLWEAIEDAAKTLPGVKTKGKFDETQTRRIVFLDTPDHTLRANGLVLRQRSLEDAIEYTLKCRSEDRCFALGTNVESADGLGPKPKMEEDIVPPFLCRYSHSVTIRVAGDKKDTSRKAPKDLGDAAAFFPMLSDLRSDGRPCDNETALEVVNHITVEETVWKGAKLVLDQGDNEKGMKASMALIVWARPKSERPAIAELSFRVEEGDSQFHRALAVSARSAFRLLQRLDAALPGGMTKTEYVYRDGSRD